MWFNDQTQEAYEKGIAPAVIGAGYSPLRIDKKEHVNKIDDEIVAEIRRSRFLVADFTCEPEKSRGGVYFEAGFALGIGLPVIFTCRKDELGKDKTHFDIEHFNHVVWNAENELSRKLELRIRATLL